MIKTKTLLDIQPGYCTQHINIATGYLEDDKLLKSINMSIWDDIAFHGYSHDVSNLNNLTFEYDVENSIYFCLDRLLGNDNVLVIDDDDTYESMEKFMLIKREEECITISFINLNSNANTHNKFRAFIKNIAPDPRSKICDNTTKPRLISFFKDCANTLSEEYHQITFREYLESERIHSLTRKKYPN